MNESVEKILGEVHEGVAGAARIAWSRVVRDRKKRSVIKKRHRTIGSSRCRPESQGNRSKQKTQAIRAPASCGLDIGATKVLFPCMLLRSFSFLLDYL